MHQKESPVSDVQESDELTSKESNDVTAQWNNVWDSILHKECPNGQAFYRVVSTHHDGYEDRLWDWYCRSYAQISSSCSWHGYVNGFDEAFLFSCPINQLMTGAYSEHHDGYEDRRWKFRCCSLVASHTYDWVHQ